MMIYVKTRQEWRAWLAANHDKESSVWLIYPKQHTGEPRVPYNDAVEEALCFGWIDSLVRRLDESRFAQLFTPRRPGSTWSEPNRRRFARLVGDGLVTPAGLARAPSSRSSSRPARVELPSGKAPTYIRKALQKNKRALQNFEKLSPSQRRRYVRWIDSAKKDETRQRRLAEALKLLQRGQKLGMK